MKKLHKTVKALTMLAIPFVLAQGCSSDPKTEPVGTSKDCVVNGWRASQSSYPSVVALVGPSSNSPFCTGTLVKPDMVITAAHCALLYTAKNTYVSYGLDLPESDTENDSLTRVADVWIHPDYNPNHDGCDPLEKCPISDSRPWNDVAVLTLTKDVKSPTCAPILEDTTSLSVGDAVRIVGYGQNWVDDSESPLYAGDVPVMKLTSFEIEVGDPDVNNTREKTGACFGDSGGPIYVERHGVVYVTGITSRSAFGPACGHGAVYELPSAYIKQMTDAYRVAKCIKSAPEQNDLARYLCRTGQQTWDTQETSACKTAAHLPKAGAQCETKVQ